MNRPLITWAIKRDEPFLRDYCYLDHRGSSNALDKAMLFDYESQAEHFAKCWCRTGGFSVVPVYQADCNCRTVDKSKARTP